MNLKRRTLFVSLWLAGYGAPLFAADRFVLPAGAGRRDGTSFAHAYDASHGGLQTCWDKLGPGDACRAGSGIYRNARLVIRHGGKDGAPKTLAGPPPGENPAVFEGNWRIRKPDVGTDFATLEPGADHVRLENLEIRRYRHGIQTRKRGRVDHLRLARLEIRDVRIGVEIYGDETCSHGPPGEKGCPQPERASHGIRIENVNVRGATKIGIRLRYGVYDAEIRRCEVDLGGKSYDVDPGGDMVGFSLGDGRSAAQRSPDRDVLFVDCTARRAFNDHGDEYWQGDGFKTEQYSTNVRFVGCRAFDNTDGGFDVKGPGTLLENCVAARNKRNFRLWNTRHTPEGRAQMINCLGHHAKYWGDKHSVANLHLFGDAWVRRSTFHNTLDVPEKVRGYSVLQQNRWHKEGFATRIEDSVISYDSASSPGTTLTALDESDYPSSFDLRNSVVWEGAEASDAPDFVRPEPSFEGGGENFNSRRYGKTKGYFWDAAAGLSGRASA